ncbi:hypothetical protein DMENIID0001_085610 [Sergentomyia squamirostris]
MNMFTRLTLLLCFVITTFTEGARWQLLRDIRKAGPSRRSEVLDLMKKPPKVATVTPMEIASRGEDAAKAEIAC